MRVKPMLSGLLLTIASALPTAHATTYRLDGFPFSYMGATSIDASVSSSNVGSFVGKAAIESYFNSSSFNAILGGASGTITSLDKHNASWVLDLRGQGSNATLLVSSEGMSLIFDTPTESSAAALVLRSASGASVFQFRQENNISDYAFARFDHNAMQSAHFNASYGQAFSLPASPVNEAPQALLMGCGTLLLGAWLRRRGR